MLRYTRVGTSGQESPPSTRSRSSIRTAPATAGAASGVALYGSRSRRVGSHLGLLSWVQRASGDFPVRELHPDRTRTKLRPPKIPVNTSDPATRPAIFGSGSQLGIVTWTVIH